VPKVANVVCAQNLFKRKGGEADFASDYNSKKYTSLILPGAESGPAPTLTVYQK
jgi:hypothetical protein